MMRLKKESTAKKSAPCNINKLKSNSKIQNIQHCFKGKTDATIYCKKRVAFETSRYSLY